MFKEKMKGAVRRMTGANKLENVEKYSPTMTLGEFCEVTGLPNSFPKYFSDEGASTIDDLLQFKDALKNSSFMGVVHKAKFLQGCRCLKASKRLATKPTKLDCSVPQPTNPQQNHVPVSQPQRLPQLPPQLPQQQQQEDFSINVAPQMPSRHTQPMPLPADYEHPDDEDDMHSSISSTVYMNEIGATYMNDFDTNRAPLDYEDVDEDQGLYEDPDEVDEVDTNPVGSGILQLPGMSMPFNDQLDYEDPDTHSSESSSKTNTLNRTSILLNRSSDIQHVPAACELPTDPNTWTNGDVLRFLDEKDLNCFKDVIYANGFEGSTFLKLSPKQFTKFSQEDRDRLGAELAVLRKKTLLAAAINSNSEDSAPPPITKKQACPTSTISSGSGYNSLTPKSILSFAQQTGQVRLSSLLVVFRNSISIEKKKLMCCLQLCHPVPSRPTLSFLFTRREQKGCTHLMPKIQLTCLSRKMN
eukprot:m.67920 g.67920  ORF g.67920 m.67920 type:complete len:470 (-) comp8231_c0_seq1:750-2159(-)